MILYTLSHDVQRDNCYKRSTGRFEQSYGDMH